MDILVQKFGGTSVASLERMKEVMGKVKSGLDEGRKVIVVLSAMAGETNRLLAMAGEWAEKPDPAEVDTLVTTGEQVSVSLFSILLNAHGIKARSILAAQIPLTTDTVHGNARILKIDGARLRELLSFYDVLVVTGFQGVTHEGRVTTLGRGGSDTSAVALAAALGSVPCDIYTDVDGVFTTDPNICSTARKLDKVSYEEMLELSSMGAKVLHFRSVEFAQKYNVPVRVRSTFSSNPGTLVTQEDDSMESVLVSGIAFDKNQARVTVLKVEDRPGVAATLFGAMSKANIIVDMIIQNMSADGRTDMTFTVPQKDLEDTLAVMREIMPALGGEDVVADSNVAKVSVVGVGMRSHSGVAARIFEALKNENINILMISTSEIKVTCLIDEKYTELAVRVLHDVFDLGKEHIA